MAPRRRPARPADALIERQRVLGPAPSAGALDPAGGPVLLADAAADRRREIVRTPPRGRVLSSPDDLVQRLMRRALEQDDSLGEDD